MSFEKSYARQVEAFGRRGDVLLGISTSGRSRNVICAFEAARQMGIQTIGLLGRDGGELRSLADISLIVPSSDTQHIQEAQIVIIHLLCELIEERMISGRRAQVQDLSRVRRLWEIPRPAGQQTAARANGRG
jgi:DNA-binding MurR/RpiR family transcriptional regulator